MTDKLVEQVARALCWKNGMNPDLSLGGDKQNWLWMEYISEAQAAIAIVLEEACLAVRAACKPCAGTGHENQVDATECEYCGRPIWAIMALAEDKP